MKAIRKFGFRVVNVHFGTFDFSFNVIVGPHHNIEKYLRWKFDEPFPLEFDANKFRGLTFSRGGYAPVVWMPRVPRKPDELATLAHEILHVIRMMLTDWANLPLTRDTDEAYCHAMSFAMKSVLEGLR